MIGPGHFGPTQIRSPGAHAEPFEETDRRLARVLERVPVTRVYDATPLDCLGIPVWAAVTPLARDLTVHAGKGETHLAARLSAVMEAIERVCAEDVDAEQVRIASYEALRLADSDGVLDPELLDLPFQTTYRPELPLSWVEGYDLLAQRHLWVPLDAVISPAREGVCSGVETNGLAAGNNHTEAVVHALCEVIERDAAAHEQFARLYLEPSAAPHIRLVDAESLPAGPSGWVQQLRERGLRTSIRNVSNDLRTPVFGATISDRSFPGSEGRLARFEGMGCDIDPERAVTRAIAEAAQSHTAVLVGARETFEDGRRHARRSADGLIGQLLSPSTIESFPADGAADKPPEDLYDRLTLLLERIERGGLSRCIVVDLTRPDLGIPVVRVLVPGAAGPYGDTSRRPPLRLLRSLV